MMIGLAPIDYYFVCRHVGPIQFLFSFNRRLDEQKLKSSLKNVLHHFYLLNGCLERVSDSELVFRIDRSKSMVAVDFRTAKTTVDLGTCQPQSASDLIDEVVPGEGEPLLKITVRQFKNQSQLGVSMSHAAGDGHSLFYFISAWARTYRHEAFDAPALDRSALWEPSLRHWSELTADRIFRDTGYNLSGRESDPPSSLTREILKYTSRDFAEMNKEAEAKLRHLSMNDVLMAHLLRKFYRYAPRRHQHVITVRCPVDYRRCHPNLTASYFGNAVRDAVAEFPTTGFSALSLGEIGSAIRRAVSSVDYQAVTRSLACFNDLRLRSGLCGFKHLSDPGLAVSTFPKTWVDSIAFGNARPIRVLNLSHAFRTANAVPCGHETEVQYTRPTDVLY
jgi:shikimate O-hydroxycinnamoyltransferase